MIANEPGPAPPPRHENRVPSSPAAPKTKAGRGWAIVALVLGVLVGLVLVSSGDYDMTEAVLEVARVALAIVVVLAITRVIRRAIQR